MANELRIKRRWSGAVGAPATLKSGELAFNGMDNTLYLGFGDNGAGVATSISAIAGGGAFMTLTGAQTIAGVKTFSSSPIVPTVATSDNSQNAASTAYVTAKVAAITIGDGDKGDITVSGAGSAWTIDAGSVTLAKMATLAANSFIGNNTGVAATPLAMTAAQAKVLLAITASDVTGGTFTAAQIPNLDAAKITTGTFTAAHIPNLDAAKIATGTFTAAHIPNLDAAKISTGVFDIARIPVLPSQKQIVSSGDLTALTAPQQAEIGQGTIVTITDGTRYVYSGTGSKTLAASYVTLADVTPEWSVIANKPTFATVATTGAYNDLTGKPTLGTMASQNANAVAITGGAISGITLDLVTIDGGTF